MAKVIGFLFLFLHLFLYPQTGQGYQVDSVAVVDDEEEFYKNQVKVDSVLLIQPTTNNTIYPKKFNPNLNSRYKGEDFDYTTIKPKEALWDRIKKKLQRILESIFGEMDPLKAGHITDNILRLLAIVVGGFVLYFLIRYLLNKDGNFFFSKRNKILDIKSGDLQENIHEINFPASILQFENQKDFRSAIRYRFLYYLKKLSDSKKIDWNPEKTNRDYYREITDEKLKKQYQSLSYIFEHVWYGEFEINESNYQPLKQQYINAE